MSPEARFEIFFKKHYAILCHGVNALLRDESLSEDLVQEVFLKIWEKRSELDFGDRFINYMKKACYHEALQVLSQQKNIAKLTPEHVIMSSNLTDDEIIERELNAAILAGIKTLSPKTQLVFTLSRYELLSYQEISKQLKISIKAVEKHMSKALRHMRVHLEKYLPIFFFVFF